MKRSDRKPKVASQTSPTETKPSYALDRARLMKSGLAAGFSKAHLESQLDLLEREQDSLLTDEEVRAGKKPHLPDLEPNLSNSPTTASGPPSSEAQTCSVLPFRKPDILQQGEMLNPKDPLHSLSSEDRMAIFKSLLRMRGLIPQSPQTTSGDSVPHATPGTKPSFALDRARLLKSGLKAGVTKAH